MLTVAARIPDAAQRDQFADRLSHKARITEEVVRAEIRKAAVHRQTDVEQVERRVPALGQIKVAERGLIWGLIREPASAIRVIAELEVEDLQGLSDRLHPADRPDPCRDGTRTRYLGRFSSV